MISKLLYVLAATPYFFLLAPTPTTTPDACKWSCDSSAFLDESNVPSPSTNPEAACYDFVIVQDDDSYVQGECKCLETPACVTKTNCRIDADITITMDSGCGTNSSVRMIGGGCGDNCGGAAPDNVTKSFSVTNCGSRRSQQFTVQAGCCPAAGGFTMTFKVECEECSDNTAACP